MALIRGFESVRSAMRIVSILSILLTATVARGQQIQQPDLLIPLPPGAQPLSPPSTLEQDPRGTEERLRALLQSDPGNADATIALAGVLLKQQRYQDAIDLLEGAAAAHPENFKLALALGQVYLETGCFCSAIEQFEAIECAHPDYPDLQYWLASAYLRADLPLTAYWISSCYGPVSHNDVTFAQTLVRGSALAQMGLQCEASGLFQQVRGEAPNQKLSQRAQELQDQMDEAFCARPRYYGILAVTERYDDNPGVLPTTNLFGVPLARERTWGNAVSGLFAYDIVRAYNFDLTAGYSFFHTSNYRAGEFNLIDNGAFLNANRRGLWGDLPYQAGMRVDYDYLVVGSESFLQRAGATPNFTIYDSDLTSFSGLFRYTRYDFLSQGTINGTTRDADSNNYAVGVFRQHQTPCRDLSFLYGYLYDRNVSDGPDFRYNGNQFQAGINWLVPGDLGLQVGLGGSIYHRDYDNPDSILMQGRDDLEYLLQAALLYPLADSWYATFTWRLDRNDSNLGAYDYDRQTFDIGLQYNFGAAVPFIRRAGDADQGRRVTY